MNISKIINKNKLETIFKHANIGIEREALRTNQDNTLALTKAPYVLGRRYHHPYLLTDFSESQPELVTPPAGSNEELFDWLYAIHDVYLRSLDGEEFLWPFSMPNSLPIDSQIPVIDVPEKSEIVYREYLAKHYGKKLQMISGIHYNFSFVDEFVEKAFEGQNEYTNFQTFKDDLYLKLSRNFLRYQWLLTYLFGASPNAVDSFYESETHPKTPPKNYYRSLRNSSFGYSNSNDVEVSFATTKDYVESIERLVEKKAISEEREFYGNARLRGKGKKVRNMVDTGIQYVEFRSVDINPFHELGIAEDQVEFTHLFFMALSWMDEEADQEGINLGNKYNDQVASEEPFSKTALYDEGIRIIELMQEMVERLGLNQKSTQLIEKVREILEDPSKTFAARLVNLIEEEGYLRLGNKWGNAYKDKAFERPYALRGFDDMELSTQMLMFDAIQRGLKVEVLDRKDQFLRLTFEDHQEPVKNGNMTSKDNYIAHWIVENKTVTKDLLAEDGFRVPKSDEYYSVEIALDNYEIYEDTPIVVKPKSTNMGVGISIFKNKFKKESFEKALEIAFEEDDTVLIEEFIFGTEYRFFVIDGKTEAVLLRKPANVVGDGKSTISQLIDEKNSHMYRGKHHLTPMGELEKGKIEELALSEQGLTFDSVVEDGQEIFLRENSNISTGGDSIDYTDEMHESYKVIAGQMAEKLNIKITGIDLIIPDYMKESTKDNPGYSVIEANFNPMMSMHAYVTEGNGRRLTESVIEFLFPELPERL